MQSRDMLVRKINNIGVVYLVKHPKGKFNFWTHCNQPIAEILLQFNPEHPTPENSRKFLLESYYRLPTFTGEIAEDIRALYQLEFEKEISRELLISSISTVTLIRIGEDYLKNHPKPSAWYSFSPHNNQFIATQLQSGILRNKHTQQVIAHPTPSQLWNILIDVYASIPGKGNGGVLAGSIQTLIKNVFQISIKTTEKIEGELINLNHSEIAVEMRTKVNAILDGMANIKKNPAPIEAEKEFKIRFLI
jgi:hypothetical protein